MKRSGMLFANLYALASCAHRDTAACKVYTSDLYGVQLIVPVNFEIDVHYFPVRLSDGKGFIQISPAGTSSGRLIDACTREADHHLLPYGRNPRVDFVMLDGQPACRIRVTNEINPYTGIGTGYVVSLPQPTRPDTRARPGGEPFIAVTADPAHMELIPRSLRFTQRSARSAIVCREKSWKRICPGPDRTACSKVQHEQGPGNSRI